MVTAPDRLTLPRSSELASRRASWPLVVAAVLPLVLPLAWSGYRIAVVPDTVLAALSPLEAPWSVRDPIGVWALLLVLAWFGLAYRYGGAAYWELPLVLLGAAVVLPRVGNAWVAAPLLAVPLWLRLRSLLLGRWRLPLSVVCIGVAAALALLLRPPDLTASTAAAALRGDGTVFSDWRWAQELQRQAPERAIMGGRGLAGEPTEYWLDYLRVVQGHERWDAILRGWGVRVLVIYPERRQQTVLALVRASPGWRVITDDAQAFVAERSEP